MAPTIMPRGTILLIICVAILLLPSPAAAFGAGNIPGIAQVEGHNWRHGDIEDMLKTVAFLRGHKWTTIMIKRVYFGNWLRDYSQAVDVGSLKGVSAPTIRILVWVLSFLSFGYATGEFEVTDDRLGVYRPEEHIDNPKGYADDKDARTFDKRLRGPILPVELEVDSDSGMKNYIANEAGGWATSSGYIKFSFARSIHFGRLYTSGAHGKSGKEADLSEALRCLGQGLHCMEDFGAHTNYVELALRELGFRDVFPHTGTNTEMNLRGHRVFPLVTGTFGAVDFLHSVLGEATDHFTQSEVEEMDLALKSASDGGSSGQRDMFGSSASGGLENFTGLLSQIPGLGGGLAEQARDLQAQSEQQAYKNDMNRATFESTRGGPEGPARATMPGMSENFDPVETARKIYPILEFRDKIVRAINSTIAKIPGLEALIERISETLTLFVLSLLSPFIRPIIEAVSKSLKEGSTEVVNASANQQFGPWNDPQCTDPTHSMLSKDHFSNELNSCAGRVAATILQYVAPRILYAWENPGVPVDEVMKDILRTFHHPAIRDEQIEIQRNMYNTVRRWVDESPNRNNLNSVLDSASVKAGRNHKNDGTSQGHSHAPSLGGYSQMAGNAASSVWSKISSRDLAEMQGGDGIPRGISPASLSQTPENFGYSGSAWGPPQPGRSTESYLSTGRPVSQQGYVGDGYNQAPYMSYQNQGPGISGGYSGAEQGPPQAGYWPAQGNPGYGPPPSEPGWGPPQQYQQQLQYGAPFGQQQQPYGQQQPPYGLQQPPYGQPQQFPPSQQYPGQQQGHPGGGYPGQGYGGGY